MHDCNIMGHTHLQLLNHVAYSKTNIARVRVFCVCSIRVFQQSNVYGHQLSEKFKYLSTLNKGVWVKKVYCNNWGSKCLLSMFHTVGKGPSGTFIAHTFTSNMDGLLWAVPR